MGKKNGVPRSRTRKAALSHPCGCVYCCGDLDGYHKTKKLRELKHKPKNWLESDDYKTLEDRKNGAS